MQGYKKILISSITVIIAFLVMWTTQTQAAATLVGQWEFDGDFTATNDSNYNGNPSGTITFVPGQNGQAASFDGGIGVGSYNSTIDCVDSLKTTPASEFNSGLSIMGWIKPDNGEGVLLGHSQSCCGMEYMGFDSAVRNDRSLGLILRSNNGGRLQGISAPGIVTFGEWFHIAFTWNGDHAGGIQLYVNGLPVATTVSTPTSPFLGLNSTGLLPVRIGADFANSVNDMYGFDGSIDHISVWKGALSADAILADYNNTKSPAPATLVAQWEFDGDFTAANDSNYNGNPSGTVTFVSGKVGQAASFDGGTGVGSNNPAIDKVDSGRWTSASEFNGGLSIMGWIKPEDQVSGYFLCHDESCCTTSAYGFGAVVGSQGTVHLTLRDSSDRRIFGESPIGAVPAGIWSHVALTWNGSTSGGIKIYINGQETTTNTWFLGAFSGLTGSAPLSLRIGSTHANSLNTIRGYVGSIDHISLWKGALSADAILADYNNTKNRAPVANAGPDQPAHVGKVVTLDGSGSTDADNDLLTYAWEFTSKPSGSTATLRNPTSVNPTFTVDKAGEYKVSLTVHDGKVPCDEPDEVIINTVNVPPVAVICEVNQPPRVGEMVLLDGSCSYDLDGDPLTYVWGLVSKPQGSNAMLSDPTAVNPTFTVDKAGEYKVSLTVHDGKVPSESPSPIATVNTTNSPPIACIQPPGDDVRVGYVVMLDGSCSRDPDEDLITYSWTFVSKPIGSNAQLNDPTAVSPTFTADKTGDYVLKLVVSDGEYSDSAQVTIHTRNMPPIADAGPDRLVIERGTTVCLDGTESYDPDGDDITYQWSFPSTPGVEPVLGDVDTQTPCFVADVRGDYIIQLTVTDPSGANSTDTMVVSFDNIKPVADAGRGGSVVLGDEVTLDGSGSLDANRDTLFFHWSLPSVPVGSQCTIQTPQIPTVATATFVPDVAGTYVVQLVVDDGDLYSDPSSIQIRVITEQTAAIEAVQDCQEIIVSLDPGVFKNANMQNTMINKFNAVIANIEAGNYADALGQLQNDILKKTDGCANAGNPDKNDWITTCAAQGTVYPYILIAIDAVEALMQ